MNISKHFSIIFLLVLLLNLIFISSLPSSTSQSNQIQSQSTSSISESSLNIINKGDSSTIDEKSSYENSMININGKLNNLIFSVPSESKIKLNKDSNNIDITITKEGTQITSIPKLTKQNKENNLNIDKIVSYHSEQFYTRLPEEIASQMGFSKDTAIEFQGTLNNDGKKWFLPKGEAISFKINGKKNFIIKNTYNDYLDVNENLNMYFSTDKSIKYEGAYLSISKGNLKLGSTNNLDGHAINLLPGNEIINIKESEHLALDSFKNSEINIKDGKLYLINGGIIEQDSSTYTYSNEKQKIYFKNSPSIKSFINSENSKTKNVPLDIIPLKSDLSPLSEFNTKIKVYDSGYKIISIEKNDDLSRLSSSLPPIESSGKNIENPSQQEIGSNQLNTGKMNLQGLSPRTGTQNPTSIYEDILNHNSPTRKIYNNADGGQTTTIHEGTHEANNLATLEIQKKLGRSDIYGYYLGNNQYTYLNDPKTTKSQAYNFLYSGFKGFPNSAADFYMTNDKVGLPTSNYIHDEWTAAIMDYEGTFDLINQNKYTSNKQDRGEITQFTFNSIAAAASVKYSNPQFWSTSKDYKDFIAYNLIRAKLAYDKSLDPKYSSYYFDANNNVNNFWKILSDNSNNDPVLARMRSTVKDVLGDKSKTLFGF